MRKATKRVVAALLSVGMLCGVSACGKDKKTANLTEDPNTVPKDTYEINWYILGSPQTDVSSVENAINEYLKDKINATVKINAMESGQYKQKMSTMVAAGDYFDIAFCAKWMLDYTVNARLGAFIALDDYMDSYLKDIKETIPAEMLDSVRVDGKMHAIPAYKECATQYGWIYRKDIADKYGIDMSKYKTLEELEPVLDMLKEKESSIQYPIDYDASNMVVSNLYDGDWVAPFESMKYIGVSYAEGDDPSKIILGDEVSNPTGEKMYKTLRRFYEKGLVKKDVGTATDLQARFNSGKTFCYLSALKPGKAAEISQKVPFEVAQAGVTPIYTDTLPGLGSMMAVSSTSKNPARAMRFLNLLNTDPYLMNLVVYGIEGKHYEKVDDKTIRLFEDSTYSYADSAWAIGNVFIDYLTTKDDPDKYEQLKKFNADAILRPAANFVFNSEGLEDKIAEVSNVYKQFGDLSANGSLDIDYNAKYKERMDAIKAAGVQQIVDAMNTQYQEYLKNLESEK